MPLVKQRDLLLMGNFSFDVNAKIKHDMWFNNAPWGAGAIAWGGALPRGRPEGWAARPSPSSPPTRSSRRTCATGARAIAKAKGMQTVYDQNYPPNTVDFSSIIRAVRAAKPDIVFVASYPAESVAIVRAVNEIGVGHDGQDDRRRHGRPAVHADHGSARARCSTASSTTTAGCRRRPWTSRGATEFLEALRRRARCRRRSIRSASTCRRSTTPSARCSSRRSPPPRASTTRRSPTTCARTR